MLCRKFCMAAKVKLEYAPDVLIIYGIRPMEESDDVETWLHRAHVSRFTLILQKTLYAMHKADRAQNYSFMDSMKPDHIIQENKAIPAFFFECFRQENMPKLIDQALEKTCFFEFTETDGVGMIHCLIEMYRIRKAMFSLNEDTAFELCASYLNKKQGKKKKSNIKRY